MSQEVYGYIADRRAEGHSDQEIKSVMIAHGYQDTDLDTHFKGADQLVSGPDKSLKVDPKSMPTGGQLLKEAWEICRQQATRFLIVTTGPGLVVLIATVLLQLFKVPLTVNLAITGILWIFYFIFQTIAQVLVLYLADENHNRLPISQLIGLSIKNLLGIWWLGIIYSLIVTGGFILFIIPGIYFLLVFPLASMVLVSEDRQGLGALLASRYYMSGRLNATLFRLGYIALFSLIVTLPIGIISFFIKSGTYTDPIKTGLNLLTVAIVTPLSTAYLFRLYRYLKLTSPNPAPKPTLGVRFGYFLIGLLPVALAIIGVIVGSIYLGHLFPGIDSLGKKDGGLNSSINSSLDQLTGAAGALNQSKDTKSKADLWQLALASRLYAQEKGQLPVTLDDLKANYIAEIPLNPSGVAYSYTLASDSQSAKVCDTFSTGKIGCQTVSLKDLSSPLDPGFGDSQ